MDTVLNAGSEVETGYVLAGGQVLGPDGSFAQTDLHIDGGVICDGGAGPARRFDVTGCLVLPGIVDAHGDGHEHHLQPRVGTGFPPWIALRNVDRELVSNGITTAFLAQSYSWEGSIRGVDAARAVIEGLRDLSPPPSADIRIQIRYETFFLDGAAQLLAWLEDGTVRYVVFNDHIPQYQDLIDSPQHISRWAATVGLSADEFTALLRKTVEEGVGVLDAISHLSAAMRRLGVPFGSHDDPDPETRKSYNDVGAHIAEFPLTVQAAQAARDLGNPIMMGAPNALRGTSASGNVSARELISRGLCDALVSDYYFPAMLHVPFTLAREGVLDLGAAWRLVSSGPAAALGLTDRGALAPGARGDVVVVHMDRAGKPHVRAVFAGGAPVFMDRALAD